MAGTDSTTCDDQAVRPLVKLALAEDLGERGDVTTSALIPDSQKGMVQIVARQPGILAGLCLAELVFSEIDPDVAFTRCADDGARLVRGTVVAEVSGRVRSLLIGERTCLNFLTHLCGVATLTRRFVEAVAGTAARIYDTRKTLPGWRALEKYAVRAGGGMNHRHGLFDMVLIKDNHLAGWLAADSSRTIAGAVRVAREQTPVGLPVEVEVDTLAQLADALAGKPDIVLLDNMSPDDLRRAVTLRDARSPEVELEASGGVTLETVATIAATGVDRISVGALTHSPPALDLAFDWKHST
jgi:nicotinate-nucleotide pyrophosphorylase (carboxylating)